MRPAMRCIDEGRLRAYLDDELGAAEQERIATHLAGCAACEARVATLRADASAVATALAAWPSAPDASPAAERERTARALATFQARLREQGATGQYERTTPTGATKEQRRTKEWLPTMIGRLSQLITPRRRPAFAAVTILAIVGLLLTLSPVQSLASGLVQQFRVRQFAAVTIRVPAMTTVPQPRDLTDAEKTQIMQAVSSLGTLDTNATPASAREVTRAEAEAFFRQNYKGSGPRLPQTLPADLAGLPARYGVVDATSTKYNLNAAVASQYLGLINSRELNALNLPATGTLSFGLDVPAAVGVAYGDERNGFAIVQLASPVLSLPDEIDVEAFRAAVLAMPNIPQETKDQLRNVKDWRSTLILPVPQDAEVSNPEIGTGPLGAIKIPALQIVDGQDPSRGSLLLWQHDGMLYAVGGHLTPAQAQAIAAGMMR